MTTFFQLIGVGTNPPFTGMSVSAEVSSSPAGFQLAITANALGTSDAPWSLATLFPALGQPLAEPVASAGFMTATLVMDSTNTTLDFNGALFVESAALLPVAFCFPADTTLAMTGSIGGITAGWPVLSISGKGTAGLGAIRPKAVLTTMAATGTLAAAQSTAVAIDLPFAGGITISILWPYQLPFTFNASTDGEPFSFSDLLAIFDFGTLLPAQLPLPQHFGLTGFGLSIESFDTPLVVDLDVSAGTDPSYQWSIADVLTLESVSFVFGVSGLQIGSSGTTIAPGGEAFAQMAATIDLGSSTKVSIAGSYPGFVLSGSIDFGDIGLDLQQLVGNYFPTAGQFVPALTLNEIDFTLDPNSPAYAFTITVAEGQQWQIAPGFAASDLVLSMGYAASHFDMSFQGSLTSPLTANVSASFSGGVWQFAGSVAAFNLDDLQTLANELGFTIPLPSITVSNLSLLIVHGATTVYTFSAGMSWDLPVGSETLALTGSLLLTNPAGKVDAVISGSATFGKLSLAACYDVSTKTATFVWEGITGTVAGDTITFTFPNIDVGTLIDHLVEAATAATSFSLTPPFDALNGISFDDLTVTASFPAKGEHQLSVSVPIDVDLIFATFTNITLETDFKKVNITLDYSSFFGPAPTDQPPGSLTWDVTQPSSTPAVPSAGVGMLQIDYLLLAQRIAPTTPLDTSSVTNAVTSMQASYSPPSGPALVQYSATTDWVIGARLKLLNGQILINGVFVDPGLYGIDVALSGDLQLAGLDVEIMYKRVNDSIGVYETAVTLPPRLRTIELGEVLVNLPSVLVQIYTNGNFYIDFGFPTNNDWSKSASVFLDPFVGLGGFYFGALNGATAGIPKPTSGSYSPVIEVGLAVSVGLGGSLSVGPLSGSLSLTVGGMAQGIFAWLNQSDGSSDIWYQITGTFALVGQISGTVNFIIISASFALTANASLTIQFGSDGPVIITFTASVSVSVSIHIVFVTISFSFGATISDTYTIGSGGSGDSSDSRIGSRSLLSPRRVQVLPQAPAPAASPLVWSPISGPQTVPLMVASTLTSASPFTAGTASTPVPQIVVMTCIGTATSGASPFSSLATGALLWSINALLQLTPPKGSQIVSVGQIREQPITTTQLQTIATALQQNGAPTLAGITALLPQLYQFQLAPLPATGAAATATASVFPMLPQLTLTTPAGTVVDFSTFNPVTPAALTAIQNYFAQLRIAPPGTTPSGLPNLGTDSPSFASVLLGDYFTFLCRAVVQAALTVSTAAAAFTFDDTIDGIIESAYETDLTPEIVAAWNRLRRLRPGVTVALPDGGRYTVGDTTSETLLGIARRHRTTAGELARANRATPGFFADAVAVPGDTQQTAGSLVDAMVTAGGFDAQAGLVARLFLQGMRPPGTTGTTTETQALYSLTGQQFSATKVVAGSTYQIAVDSGASSWISPAKQTVTISAEDAKILATYDGPIAIPLAGASLLPPRTSAPRHFTLAAPVIWNWTSGATPTWSVWQLPANLLQMIASGVAPQLAVEELGSDTPSLPNMSLQGAIDPVVTTWAMTFEMTVRRIPSAKNTSAPMSFTYQLVGTDDAGLRVLEQILQTSPTGPAIDQIYILFPLGTGTSLPLPSAGVQADPTESVTYFVLQTNFSTLSSPESTNFTASPPPPTPFPPLGMTPYAMLEAIYACSVVHSGGYYFYYRNDAGTSPAGLPKGLFASDGRARLTVVVTLTPPDDGALATYVNTLVAEQTVDPDTLLTLVPAPGATVVQNDSVQAYPAGQTVLLATRTMSADSALEETYQLLGYRIGAAGGFAESNFAVPLSPTDPPAQGAAQVYQANIPIAASATTTTNPPPNEPSPAGDPYNGVGTQLQIDLDWFDVFGNRIQQTTPLAPLTQTIGYFDPLIPISAWTAMAASYAISANGLAVTFDFDTLQFQPKKAGDTTWIAAAQNAATQYALIYYQLARNTTVTVASTLDTTLDGGVTQLLDFVIDIYAYLQSILATPPTWGQKSLTLTQTFVVADRPAQDSGPIYQLTVGITIARTPSLIDPSANIAGDPAVSVTSLIQPAFEPISATAPTPSLLAFAKNLNTAFPALVAATGHVDVTLGLTADQVWLVRFGSNGITCTYDQSSPLAFYAPLPLAGSPVSAANVAVPVYVSGQGLSLTTNSTSFTNVDLDLVARNFLAAVDQFLTADYAAPAWLASPALLADVQSAKQSIASSIAANVAPILAGGAPSQAATDRMQQELLVRLSSAYSITALVQFEATASGAAAGQTLPPRLYGSPAITVPPSTTAGSLPPTFAFSPVSIPLTSQDSIVTFAFTTSEQDETMIGLGIDIAFNHLQFDIETIGALPYQASSWLTFAMPLASASPTVQNAAAISLGAVGIPIPIRAFPAPPVLAAQSVLAEGSSTLAQTKQWDYSFEYSYAGFLQDDVGISIQTSAATTAPAAPSDLAIALLTFKAVYPSIAPDLYSAVCDDESLSTTNATANAAIDAFSTLVSNVATAWASWSPATPPAAPPIVISEVPISYPAAAPQPAPVLQVTVTFPSGGPTPTVDIDGFTRQLVVPQPATGVGYVYFDEADQVYLSADDAASIPKRTFVQPGYDVLVQQQAAATLVVSRNETYGVLSGNPLFVLTTPAVQYINPAIPLLNVPTAFPLTTWTTSPAPVATYLQNFLTAFLSDPAPPAGGWPIQLSVAFTYGNGAPVPMEVTIPVAMLPSTLLAPNAPAISAVASFVATWLANTALPSGTLQFSLSLFSNSAQTPLPLLSIARITLDVTDIAGG